MRASTNCTRPQYVCGNEKIKLIGGIDGYFPDFGHHLENEMGGLWLYPVKLLDGFWMRFTDHTDTADGYMKADRFENYPHKNEFYYGNGLGHTTVTAKRTQLAPEGMKGLLVKYCFANAGGERRRCTAEMTVRVNLRPVWLAEEAGIHDGERDEMWFLEEEGCFLAKDSANPWYAAIGCSEPWEEGKIGEYFGPENTSGNGVSCVMRHSFCLEPGETRELTFYIAGSLHSREEALEQYQGLREDRPFEEEKEAKYREILERSRLTVGDKRFQEIYDWVKVNSEWLVLDQEDCGRGIMAGLPEYPWWFGCDSFYTLQGLLGIGDTGLCRDTLRLIRRYSEKVNGDGKIVHEILPNGFCPNPGNTQETAHFVTMVWKYYEWTGDLAFLEECLPYIRKSIAWLKEQDADGDLYPSGYGIIEIAGLDMEMIDTIVYTCEAYGCYAEMLKLAGETEDADRYRALCERMKEKINSELWDERAGLFCDAFSSYAVIEKKRDLIEKLLARAASEEIRTYICRLLEERKADGASERGWLLNRNWVINTPMETGIADREKARRALEQMKGSDYIGTYGMYLDALTQNAAMTISTGVMAVAQSMYQDTDEALRLLEKMFLSFSMATPGSISEMSPDYGCFVQAWTAYAVFLPVVRFFFGITPRASEGSICIEPCLPGKWEDASLENVSALDGTVSVYIRRAGKEVWVTVENQTSYPAYLRCPYGCEGPEAVCAPGETKEAGFCRL